MKTLPGSVALRGLRVQAALVPVFDGDRLTATRPARAGHHQKGVLTGVVDKTWLLPLCRFICLLSKKEYLRGLARRYEGLSRQAGAVGGEPEVVSANGRTFAFVGSFLADPINRGLRQRDRPIKVGTCLLLPEALPNKARVPTGPYDRLLCSLRQRPPPCPYGAY